MRRSETTPGGGQRRKSEQSGSAMVLAIFMMVLLAGMGSALLFLSETEVRMSQASLRSKKAFYFAEAGLESARETLWTVNRHEDFSDDLSNGIGGGAAGLNLDLDFDADALVPLWNPDGSLAGLTGYGDDRPLQPLTQNGDGWYAAFLTNDPLEGELIEADGNDRVMITAIGVAPDRSYEIVQAIIEKFDILPTVPPATITLLGPQPIFEGGNSNVKNYVGDDCGLTGGMYVPIVGTVGAEAEESAEAGIEENPQYETGSLVDEETFADLTDDTEEAVIGSGMGSIDMDWTVCENVRELIEAVRLAADTSCCTESVVCNPVTACPLPTTFPNHIFFVDGDYDLHGSVGGQGTLLVTGELEFSGNADWDGLILVFGEGSFVRSGGGNGTITGGTMAANIAGADNIYGTDDDCTGPADGFDQVHYDESGGGHSDTVYCSTSLAAHNPVTPYEIVEFLQW